MTRSAAPTVAVVGALGLVGEEMIKTLEQREFPVGILKPLEHRDLAGGSVTFARRRWTTQEAEADAFCGVDIALFATSADVSRKLAPEAARRGAIVIDNSTAWRADPRCPLVVPEVNGETVASHCGIIANPNCATIQLVVALSPLRQAGEIMRIVVSTYQSASGAGRQGRDELISQCRSVLAGSKPHSSGLFAHQLAFNVLPQVGEFEADGYTAEEWKMVHETRRILGDPDVQVAATCARVPSLVGHAESVYVELSNSITADEARAILRSAPGVTVMDDPARYSYPMPLDCAGRDEVFVGRIREDISSSHALNLWVASDNVRKGAALNAIQIAEIVLARGLETPLAAPCPF